MHSAPVPGLLADKVCTDEQVFDCVKTKCRNENKIEGVVVKKTFARKYKGYHGEGECNNVDEAGTGGERTKVDRAAFDSQSGV